jgi:hypothetical protein
VKGVTKTGPWSGKGLKYQMGAGSYRPLVNLKRWHCASFNAPGDAWERRQAEVGGRRWLGVGHGGTTQRRMEGQQRSGRWARRNGFFESCSNRSLVVFELDLNQMSVVCV